MRIDFPYFNMPFLEVPDENIIGVYQPHPTSSAQPEEEVIKQGLPTPIGTCRVSEIAREGQRVLILCDSNTRPTPASLIMPYILDELRRGGARKRDVRILMALGTHRPMIYNEMCEKLGERTCEEYQVINHAWRSESSLAYMGTTGSGVEILVRCKIQRARALHSLLLHSQRHPVPGRAGLAVRWQEVVGSHHGQRWRRW